MQGRWLTVSSPAVKLSGAEDDVAAAEEEADEEERKHVLTASTISLVSR
jgi:hypothetical protein